MKKKNREWVEPQPVNQQEGILQFAGGNQFLSNELIRRGFDNPNKARGFLNPRYYHPASPFDLPDMDTAVHLMETALLNDKVVGVWGDFDVDGQTSTSLLVEGLQRLGHRVQFHIPVRKEESHGIQVYKLDQFIKDGIQVLLTCDTGITAHSAVSFAKNRGLEVIITDHHTIPAIMPEANAILNPRRLTDDHPLANLSGVGTAFKFLEALYHLYCREEELQDFYDLVALGTVADLANLTGENRFLVQKGIINLREGRRPAVKALLTLSNINPESITEEHISYVIAPRLNSIGRLADANPMVGFLSSKDQSFINVMASHLEGLNIHRKLLCDQVLQSALDKLEKNPDHLSKNVIVLEKLNWPAGVIGIVASRLVELYQIPAILLSSDAAGIARGSARSIEGINITKAIEENSQFLLSFGGHPMAAGLSIKSRDIPAFQNGISKTITHMKNDLKIKSTLEINSYLDLSGINQELTAAIEALAPFGPGNPVPIFVSKDMIIRDVTPLGKNGEHSKISLEDSQGNHHEVIWWQSNPMQLPNQLFDLAYTFRNSNYQGRNEIQIQWLDFRIDQNSQIISASSSKKYAIFDFRAVPAPEEKICSLWKETNMLVWAEGVEPFGFSSVNRQNLRQAENLLLATIPPGLLELKQILRQTSASNLYLFSISSRNDDSRVFLTQLSGLALYAVRNLEGWFEYNLAASRLGHREVTVHKGLEWLFAKGLFQPVNRMENAVQIRKGDKHQSKEAELRMKSIQELIQETRAFRNYYANADMADWMNNLESLV